MDSARRVGATSRAPRPRSPVARVFTRASLPVAHKGTDGKPLLRFRRVRPYMYDPATVKNAFLFWIVIGSLMNATSAIGVSAAGEAGPTGASQAWTSDDPRVVEAREFVMRGEFAKVEKLLAGRKEP